jgi:1,4-dihydroxy-2-naphthoate octaprenyltransferase
MADVAASRAAGTPGGVSTRRAWWLATRPFSFPASIVPVLVGTAAAAATEFGLLLFVLAFAGGLLIHAGTNLATDFFDFTHGVQPAETLGGGNLRSGLLKASDVHKAAIATFAAGSACGFAIIAILGWQDGWPILAAGVFSVLAGYFYTARPIMYGRRGLGEVVVFLFMGVLMVMASYYVQTQALTWPAFYASVPVGILVANILHANNLRDIENDRARHKVTIAGIIGRPAADVLLWVLTLAAYASVIVTVAAGQMTPWCLLVAFSLPAAVVMLRALAATEARTLNALVRASARLHMHFGLLLALGYLIEAVS